MTSYETIIEAVDEHIEEELDSDRTVGQECTRTSYMLEQVLPYSSSQIGGALGKHPEMRKFDIEHPQIGVWTFKVPQEH